MTTMFLDPNHYEDLEDLPSLPPGWLGMPETYEEIVEFWNSISDLDDTSKIPHGLPPKRYWPDPDTFGPCSRFVPKAGDISSLAEFRDTCRTNLWFTGTACRWCAKNFDGPEDGVLDHVIPLIRGGVDHRLNYTLACERCHDFKADLTPSEVVQCFLTGAVPAEAAKQRIVRELSSNRRVERAPISFTIEFDGDESYTPCLRGTGIDNEKMGGAA